MKKFIKKSYIAFILVLSLFIQILPLGIIKSYAANEKGDITNIRIQTNKIIVFDAYEGAVKYRYTYGKMKTTTQNNYIDPYFDMMSMGWDSGTYPLSLVALDENGDEISNTWYSYFEFVAPHPKLDTPQNLKWKGTKATWDMLEHASQYTVELYDVTDGEVIAYKGAYGANPEVDFSEELSWDYCQGKDFTFNVSATSLLDDIWYDTELLEATMWPDSDMAYGTDIYHVDAEKYNLDDVEFSQENGFLRFGPYYDNYRVKFTFGNIEEYIDDTTYIDLKNKAKDIGLANGTYKLELISVDENNNELSYPWTGSYQVNSEYLKLKDPINLDWCGESSIKWEDPNNAEDVEKYKIEIYNRETGEIIVSTESKDTQYNYSSEQNYFLKNNVYLFRVQAIGWLCPSSNVVTAPMGLYGWYEKSNLENVTLNEDILSWNKFNDASSYLCEINGKRINTSKTSLDLKDIAKSNNFETGTYEFSLVALDNNEKEISNTYRGSFEFIKKEIKIEASVDKINFGAIQENSNEEKNVTIKIKNTGNVPVTIDCSNPVNDGPFGSLGFDNEKLINPEESIDITLRYNTSSPFASKPGYYTGNYIFNAIESEGSEFVTVEIPTSIIITSIPKFTIKFETNGGSAIDNQTIDYGSKVTKPEDPTMSGKIFAGWFEDKELTKEFDFDTTITKVTTIYAKWIMPENTTYTVTFNTTDGSIINNTQVEEGKKLDKPDDPTKDGYIFDGWYIDENYSKLFDFENDTITGDIILYAKWTEQTLKLELSTNSIDFGSFCIPFEGELTKVIKIKNVGNVPITISNTNPTGSGPFGCIWYDSSKEIKPNESIDVTLKVIDDSPFINTEGTYTGAYEFTAKSSDGILKATASIKAKVVINNHNFQDTLTKATLDKDGFIGFKCLHCGKTADELIINHPKTFTLSKKSYTYNGKVQKLTVTVKDVDGNIIHEANYDVKYSSGCKNVGEYSVTITFKGNYSGTKKLSYKINPKGTTLSKVKAGKKSFTATWKKQATQTTGYQIQYSKSSKFASGNKTVTIKKNKTVKTTIKKLTAKKKYYVRIRTYKTVKGKKYYSGWSKVKTVTPKK